MQRKKQTITSQTKPQTLQIITKVNITCHGKWFAGSSLEIRLSKNDITGKIAYQSTLQTLQKWELCTLGTTFLVSAQALSLRP